MPWEEGSIEVCIARMYTVVRGRDYFAVIRTISVLRNVGVTQFKLAKGN